ncbi:glycosyltransferase family 2 protein [Thermodesulfobacteriota bacterium]
MEESVQASQIHVPELSVVILFYRAEDMARELVTQISKELSNEGIDYELVLVGNYFPNTRDSTPEILKEMAKNDPRCIVIARVKEGMMGWDMRSGLEVATGSYIAVIDGDGQMPVSDVVKVYLVLKVGKYDLVKTFRSQRFDGFYRRSISYFYNLFFRLLFRSASMLRDINSKPKIMTREAYEKMNLISNDWFTDAEIMIEALKKNLIIGEVSTIFYKNERRSTFIPVSAIFEFLANLLKYRFLK